MLEGFPILEGPLYYRQFEHRVVADNAPAIIITVLLFSLQHLKYQGPYRSIR